MNQLQPEEDGSIVGNTIAELSIVLLMMFFLALTVIIARTGALTGTPHDSITQAFNTLEVPEACEVVVDDVARSVSVTTGDPEHYVLFEVKNWEPTPFGRECLGRVCERLFIYAHASLGDGEFVQINGHASSEWDPKSLQFCQDGACQPCADAFECNLRLSWHRSHAVYRLCRSPFVGSDVDEHTLDTRLDFFNSAFRTGGFSSAATVGTAAGEDRPRSRRVDFVIREK